jgi:hypothetical protein
MPIQKVKGGYRWGSRGKVYPTRTQAMQERRVKTGEAPLKRPKAVRSLKEREATMREMERLTAPKKKSRRRKSSGVTYE